MEKPDELNADIIGLSALLTTSMPFMIRTIDVFNAKKLNYPNLVGGAPVTQDVAGTIGATGYADNAADAVTLCKSLMVDRA